MADPESPEIPVQQEDLSPPLPSTASKQQEAFNDSAAFGRKNSAQSTASADSKEGKGEGGSPTGGSPPPGGSLAPSSPPARGAVEAEEGGLANERGEWGNHCEFFLTALGLAVGLGNVWRFPYVCYENGGGTFLVPYLLCLLILGLPLFFLEMLLGQYAGTSATKIFGRLAPGLRGLGYGMMCITIMMAFYYTVIMAWSFYYLFMGMRATLPWQSCTTAELLDISTIDCFTKFDNDLCSADQTYWNKTCTPKKDFCEHFGFDNFAGGDCTNSSSKTPISGVTKRIAATEEFFKRKMLGQGTPGVEDTWDSYGDPQWEVIGCLALAWTILALSLVRGMQSYGKLTYFITLFPYVVLTTFLIMGSQQDGFSTGITEYYLKPDWERIYTDFDVWTAACTQIFYSLGVGVGSQLLLSSYNSFNTNCHRDAWLIALGNSFTSVYAGFVVFGTLGMLAEHNGVPVEDVITAGEGLTFQVYPEAILQFPVPQLFNFLFFFMLCLLAMSSIVGMWEPIVAALLDELPHLRKYRAIIYISSCFVAFLGGLSCCFPSGFFMFSLLNDHTANTVLYFGLLEVVVVAWFYGVTNFMDNIAEMKVPMPWPLRYFWMGCWSVITPVLCIAIVILRFINNQPDGRDGYTYPPGVQALGWMIELFPVSVVLVWSLYTVVTRHQRGEDISFLQTGPLLSPGLDWSPREDRPRPVSSLGAQNLAFYSSVGDEKRTDL